MALSSTASVYDQDTFMCSGCCFSEDSHLISQTEKAIQDTSIYVQKTDLDTKYSDLYKKLGFAKSNLANYGSGKYGLNYLKRLQMADPKTTCLYCFQTFNSRNQLYGHLDYFSSHAVDIISDQSIMEKIQHLTQKIESLHIKISQIDSQYAIVSKLYDEEYQRIKQQIQQDIISSRKYRTVSQIDKLISVEEEKINNVDRLIRGDPDPSDLVKRRNQYKLNNVHLYYSKKFPQHHCCLCGKKNKIAEDIAKYFDIYSLHQSYDEIIQKALCRHADMTYQNKNRDSRGFSKATSRNYYR